MTENRGGGDEAVLGGFRGRRLKFGVLSGWLAPSLGGGCAIHLGGNTDTSNSQQAVISILLNPLRV